eukprot:1187370-Prorocentrum_minimum.AAC.2
MKGDEGGKGREVTFEDGLGLLKYPPANSSPLSITALHEGCPRSSAVQHAMYTSLNNAKMSRCHIADDWPTQVVPPSPTSLASRSVAIFVRSKCAETRSLSARLLIPHPNTYIKRQHRKDPNNQNDLIVNVLTERLLTLHTGYPFDKPQSNPQISSCKSVIIS